MKGYVILPKILSNGGMYYLDEHKFAPVKRSWCKNLKQKHYHLYLVETSSSDCFFESNEIISRKLIG